MPTLLTPCSHENSNSNHKSSWFILILWIEFNPEFLWQFWWASSYLHVLLASLFAYKFLMIVHVVPFSENVTWIRLFWIVCQGYVMILFYIDTKCQYWCWVWFLHIINHSLPPPVLSNVLASHRKTDWLLLLQMAHW